MATPKKQARQLCVHYLKKVSLRGCVELYSSFHVIITEGSKLTYHDFLNKWSLSHGGMRQVQQI